MHSLLYLELQKSSRTVLVTMTTPITTVVLQVIVRYSCFVQDVNNIQPIKYIRNQPSPISTCGLAPSTTAPLTFFSIPALPLLTFLIYDLHKQLIFKHKIRFFSIAGRLQDKFRKIFMAYQSSLTNFPVCQRRISICYPFILYLDFIPLIRFNQQPLQKACLQTQKQILLSKTFFMNGQVTDT